MYRVCALLLLALGAAAPSAPAQTVAVSRLRDTPASVTAHNVRVTDKSGVATDLVAFYRLSGEAFFRGSLGAADIEVPYARLKQIVISPAVRPGLDMRAMLHLRSGRKVSAMFGSREGRVMFTGLASFGRLQIFFQDVRRLEFMGPTKKTDLPDFGEADSGLNVRLVDREQIESELIFFRRAVGRNQLPGVLGSATIDIPFRIVRRLRVWPREAGEMHRAEAVLRSGATLSFYVPVAEESLILRGDAEFGLLRIRLGDVRRVDVRGVTRLPRFADACGCAEPEGCGCGCGAGCGCGCSAAAGCGCGGARGAPGSR